MSLPSSVHYGDVLVISEGADRLSWSRDRVVGWTPQRLWPDEHQAAGVSRRLSNRSPVLVLIGGTEATVPLLDEQLAAAAPAVAALARDVPGDLVTLRIPALDWLPPELRRRGLRFVRESSEAAARTPLALRPRLVLEDPDPVVPHLRFAHRIGPNPHLQRDLPAIVEHAFGGLGRSEAA